MPNLKTHPSGVGGGLPKIRTDEDEHVYGHTPRGIKGTGLKSGGATPPEPAWMNATPISGGPIPKKAPPWQTSQVQKARKALQVKQGGK